MSDRNAHRIPRSLLGGLAGAAAFTLVHEVTRHARPDVAPRLDTLAERATAKGLSALGLPTPSRDALYDLTLAGDLAANAAYFALAGTGRGAPLRGALLGAAAGVASVALPPAMNLGRAPTRRSRATKLLTIAYYAGGGLVAGIVSRAISDDQD